MDGLEVTRRIRALSNPTGRVPIIGLTARALFQDREDCLRAGMHDVVFKPFAPGDLWVCMQRVILATRPASPTLLTERTANT